MNYLVDDDVPVVWKHIIDTFLTTTEYYTAFNKSPDIYDIKFSLKRGLLQINFSGGDRYIDALAFMSRQMSAATCSSCGIPAIRKVFGSPKCDECD